MLRSWHSSSQRRGVKSLLLLALQSDSEIPLSSLIASSSCSLFPRPSSTIDLLDRGFRGFNNTEDL
jgi:hypothetical protein